MIENHFHMEHVIRTRHQELLKEAAALRRADAARRAAHRSVAASRRRPTSALAVMLGRALVSFGRRLQGSAVQAVEARRCELCGESLHARDPIGLL